MCGTLAAVDATVLYPRGRQGNVMRVTRRGTVTALAAAALVPGALRAGVGPADPAVVIRDWYRLVLELVRHTATMSPPVASRAFAYLGVTLWEALAAPGTRSLAGQLTGLAPSPARPPGLDDAAVLHGALSAAVVGCFGNTGPSGQRALQVMTDRQGGAATAGLDPAVAAASLAHGRAVAGHVLAWAATDGGAEIANMGFPTEWPVPARPSQWVPTTVLVRLQQTPLLPGWGTNRAFALPAADACALPPPPAYSEDPGSAFHAEAMEVVAVSRALTDEQKLIARFWSDDPMLSPTPPGHWVAIAMGILQDQGATAVRQAEVLALLGIALADAFIACWQAKYAHDLLRPVTYIRRVIDKGWEPLLITPPFPEYPSGHSTQSGAAAGVLARLFGDGFAFVDRTHVDEGLGERSFASLAAAAEEAALSRLYGGIHFRSGVERGLDQGACVAGHVNALRLWA
jgi:membrane-associated phospholipid phosphatase